MSLLDTLLTYYMYHQSQKPPKSYNVPESPEQQWLFNFMRDYTEQGNPYRDLANGFAQQYVGGLGGMSAPPNFRFMSPAMQGQQFAGGLKMPQIDPSKFSTMPGGSASPGGTGTTGGATPGAQPPSGGTGANVANAIPSGGGGGLGGTNLGQTSTGATPQNFDIGQINAWITAHPTTVAIVQALVGRGVSVIDAGRAVYNYFNNRANPTTPHPSDPSAATPLQGPGYDSGTSSVQGGYDELTRQWQRQQAQDRAEQAMNNAQAGGAISNVMGGQEGTPRGYYGGRGFAV